MSLPLKRLSGLLEFECAARWSSFRLAAIELHKTPAAISLQVKQLEATLGFPLFIRHPRQVVLTDKGRDLAVTLGAMFKDLQAKVATLRDSDEASVLRLSTTHSFAMKWLAPRLHRFAQQHPDLDLRIEATDALASLDDGSCDLAVRYTGVAADDLLFRDDLVVVFSPRIEATSLDEALTHPLLYEGTSELWLRFMMANGRLGRGYPFSRSYSHGGLLVQAAVAGHGVALVPYSLAYEDLAQGRLVSCPCKPLPSRYGYRLVFDENKRQIAKIQAFIDWMQIEASEMAEAFKVAFPRP